MMTTLKKRIVKRAASSNLTVIGTLNGPTSLPMTRMVMTPGTLGYQDLQYAITADGAPMIAVPVGGFGALYRAGKP